MGTVIVVASLLARQYLYSAPVVSSASVPKTTPPPDGAVLHVARVIDGDTFVLDDGWHVRYIGINAPEIAHEGNPTPAQCFGDAATKLDEQLVADKDVRLVKDVSETDKYGRLLRYVYVGDEFINNELVQEGAAKADTFPPDTKFKNQFEETQAQARYDSRGMWATCSK